MNSIVTDVANFILLFSKTTFIVPLIIIGYIWLDRKVFYGVTCLLMFSIMVNTALKNIFQVSLSPLLGKAGYAFPSGHMQASTVLYGWIAIAFKNTVLRMLIMVLLMGIAISLMYFGYHNLFDIAGAVFFASLLIGFYYLLSSKKPEILPWLLISLASLLMVIIHFMPEVKNPPWLAFYTLIGFVVSEKLFGTQNNADNFLKKLITTVICITLIFMIISLFNSKIISDMPPSITQLKWALIGFTLPASYKILNI